MRTHLTEILRRKLMKFSVADIDSMYLQRDAGDTQIVTLKLIAEVIKGINEQPAKNL